MQGNGTPEDCTASSSLVSSALCNISIGFEPKETGPLTGTLAIEDNTLNAPGTRHSGELQGIGDAVPPPRITSLNTTHAAPYSVVILNGANFGATQGSSTVTFNGIPTPHYYWANTKIYVTVPPEATTGDVVVTVDGELSNAVAFTVAPMPVVTGISPTSGPAGTVVSIHGKNLLDLHNAQTVTFNGVLLPISYDSGTVIKVAIPAGAASGEFHVLVNDTGINTSTFTVTP